jgi:hypothetical protein
VAMEHSSTPSLLLVKLNVRISILLCVPALYVGAKLMNEMSASRGNRALPPVYIVVYFQFSFICRLACFECFLGRPSNVSAPKATLRLSCYPKPGFMASKSRCRRLSTREKWLRKDKTSEPTFIFTAKLKLKVYDDLKFKFQSLSTVCLIKQP